MNPTKGEMSEECPTIEELLLDETVVASHIDKCRRCRALISLGAEFDGIEGEWDPPVFERAAIPPREPLAAREVGEVVAFRRDEDDGRLLIGVILATSDRDHLEVVPLSVEVGYAAEWDLCIGPGDSPLGYQVIAEVWNRGWAAGAQMVESFGRIATERREQLCTLYAAVSTSERPADLPTGPPVLSDEDPRLAFQDREVRRVAVFWQAAPEPVAAAEPSIGARVALWLEDSGNDPGDLAREAGWAESDVLTVLGDRIDPRRAAFAEENLARLLVQTDIETEEVERLLPLGVPPAFYPQSPTHPADTTPVFRRAPGVEKRLKSTRSSSSGDEPTPEQRAAFEEWIGGVIAALEELRD